MKVMIGGVAGGFLVLIIAIVIVCISMRNIQRNNAKKERENMQRVSQNGDRDAVSNLCYFQKISFRGLSQRTV